MAEPLAIVERIEGGVIIRMNRPEKRNAVNDALAAAVIAALDAAEADADVRAILLTGSGNSFCAGQDMAEATGRVERQTGGAGGSGGLSARLAKVEKPVVGAINGFCMGGGTVTALHCDIRICSEAATFRFPGAGYGLVVAASLLPAAVGQARAKDLILTGRTIDAAEALEMGLVNKVVPADDVEALAKDYVHMIAANSPGAVRYAKQVVNLASLHREAIEREVAANRELRGGDEHRERFNAATDRVVGHAAQPV
ncbi:MAG: enoyl-CoA hydratase/isomerase family protein [Dehalococcoidia bacterium]